MEAPTVKNIKVYVVIEQVLDPHCSPHQLNEYLRKNRFTGKVNFSYDANYNQGGAGLIVTKEHIPVSMEEIDMILANRGRPS